ncbi:MAG: T9SS type A sorting domain-containing protein [Chitinophagaceae bacterium]|nr:T9SS type A sorting domain-containing protein [Chitinophagaceae bacterium]
MTLPNGGTNWWNTLEVTGSTAGQACWSYAGTGIANANYDGNNTPTVVTPVGSGLLANGPSTVIIRGLPIGITNLRVRITMDNSNDNERWVIDDVQLIRTSNGPLVVNFDNVNAKKIAGTGVVVNWSNLTESEVNFYEVERSADGKNFTAIAKVQPKANDYSAQTYSFTDATAVGNAYYRIKAVELNGTVKNSIILKVSGSNAKAIFSVYPNPVQNKVVAVQCSNVDAGVYTFSIFNSTGQQVFVKTMSLQQGVLSQSLELPASLKTGIYMLRIEGVGIKSVTTLVIQ